MMVRLRTLSLVALMAFAPCPAAANWLSELGHIATTAGKTGGRLAGDVSGGLRAGATAISKLDPDVQKFAIAAEALPDGAWRLRNAAGETITATGPEGLGAALKGLQLEGSDTSKLKVFIDEESAFRGREALDGLPKGAELHLATDDVTFPLVRRGGGETTELFAEIGGTAVLAMKDRKLFGEALWQLRRPLGKSGLRVLSLDPGGPKAFASLARRSPEGMPLAETIDPAELDGALYSLRGGTALVTGKIEDGVLAFTGPSGAEGTLKVTDLMAAAERSDVNIFLLDAGAAKQPGGTTWLFQERGIAKLDEAMAKANLGDFIAALSKGQGRLEVGADWGAGGHFRLSVKPADSDLPVPVAASEGPSLAEQSVEFALDLAGRAAGNVAPQSLSAGLNGRDRQWDLDNRLVPGVPAGWQIWALTGLLFGTVAFFETRRWWRFAMRRLGLAERPGTWGSWFAQGSIYWLLFTPILGWATFVALIVRMTVQQFVDLVTFLGSLGRRGKAGAS